MRSGILYTTEARTVQYKCTVHCTPSSGRAGQSVRRPPPALSVQQTTVTGSSSLSEEKIQNKSLWMNIVKMCFLNEKQSDCKMGDISYATFLFFWAQPHHHTHSSQFHDWRRRRRSIKEHWVSGCAVPCAVLSEVQLCVHDETANGDSVLRILRVFYLNFAVD